MTNETPIITNYPDLNIIIECKICKKIYNEPYECSICHENFCKECIDSYKEKNNNNCYNNCKEGKFTLNRFLKNIIPELINFQSNNKKIVIDEKNPLIESKENVLNINYKKQVEKIKKKFFEEKLIFEEEAKKCQSKIQLLINLEKNQKTLSEEIESRKKVSEIIRQYETIKKLKKAISEETREKEKYNAYLNEEEEEEYEEEYEDENDEYN